MEAGVLPLSTLARAHERFVLAIDAMTKEEPPGSAGYPLPYLRTLGAGTSVWIRMKRRRYATFVVACFQYEAYDKTIYTVFNLS